MSPAPKPGEGGAVGMGPDEIEEVIELLDAGKVNDARKLLLEHATRIKPINEATAARARIKEGVHTAMGQLMGGIGRR